MKTCKKCKRAKLPTAFNRLKAAKDGLSYICRACNTLECSIRYNPVASAETKLKRAYGIGLADKRRMFEVQQGKCTVCQVAFKSLTDACVDHDHLSLKVRDLLCSACNLAMGHVKENFDTALRLAKYIQNHKSIT